MVTSHGYRFYVTACRIVVNVLLERLTTHNPHYIETSQLICNANQLTGFYMMGNIGR